MPLRDHFRGSRRWGALYGGWPAMIAAGLNTVLPERYVAELLVHLGALEGGGDDGRADWGRPTLVVETGRVNQDAYEVSVFDDELGRLVAAVELVGPRNKDLAEHRRAFVTKCAALLQGRVSVVIVDPVTDRGGEPVPRPDRGLRPALRVEGPDLRLRHPSGEARCGLGPGGLGV